MSNRLKTSFAIAGASAALFGASGCYGDSDYTVTDKTVRIGVGCSDGGKNIIMTESEIMPSEASTPDGEKDKSSFRLRFFCERGGISMAEIPDLVGTEGQEPVDNILTLETADKYGKRVFDGTVNGTASAQAIELHIDEHSNFGDIKLHNADKLKSASLLDSEGVEHQLDISHLNQDS